MLSGVGTRETRKERGRRKGDALVRRLIHELRTRRQTRGVSQRALAKEIGWTQSEVSRLESYDLPTVSISRLAQIASVLGLEMSAGLSEFGDAIRDAGQQRTAGRFLRNVAAPPYRVFREVLLPTPGDQRAWDMLLRLEHLRIGVEVETRIRDVQALVRRVRERERDGGADEIVIVLSDSAHNRQLADQFRDALGQRYSTSPRQILAALRAGRPIPGSGVVLV